MVEYNTQKIRALYLLTLVLILIIETLQKYPSLFPSTPSEQAPDVIAYVDPKFKMPQVWRSNLNVDIQLPYDFMLSVGAMYTRDIYNVAQINMNEAEPTGVYNEQPDRIYWASKNTSIMIILMVRM